MKDKTKDMLYHILLDIKCDRRTTDEAIRTIMSICQPTGTSTAITDLLFLKEIKERLINVFEHNDWSQREFAFNMIDDWIDELKEKFKIKNNTTTLLPSRDGLIDIINKVVDEFQCLGAEQIADGILEWMKNESNKTINIEIKPQDNNRYKKKLDQDIDDDIYTVEEWKESVENGCFGIDDGTGYWVKDGMKSLDEVFFTPQLDATHVVWYNK